MRGRIFKSMSQLRRNLAYLIAKQGINPTALAKATGVQQPTIHRILKGESDDPRTATVQPLADYFGVSVEFMRTADAEAFDHGKLPEPYEVEAAPNLRRFKNVPIVGTVEGGPDGYLELCVSVLTCLIPFRIMRSSIPQTKGRKR